jgi:hypothetical protein
MTDSLDLTRRPRAAREGGGSCGRATRSSSARGPPPPLWIPPLPPLPPRTARVRARAPLSAGGRRAVMRPAGPRAILVRALAGSWFRVRRPLDALAVAQAPVRAHNQGEAMKPAGWRGEFHPRSLPVVRFSIPHLSASPRVSPRRPAPPCINLRLHAVMFLPSARPSGRARRRAAQVRPSADARPQYMQMATLHHKTHICIHGLHVTLRGQAVRVCEMQQRNPRSPRAV